jgi:2-polyprenyl-3-methyl-5-hydroxy-6-metoxy-1,4-benzoquinol methylase
MHPLPTAEDVTGLYADSYDGATSGYFAKVDKKMRRSRGRMRYLSRFVRGGSFLDIGCSGGFMVEAARERGFDAHGLDIDGVSIAYARRHYPDNTFFHGTIASVAAAPEALRFDLIYCSEVIEHLSDVQAFTAAVAGLLRPGGVFFVTTPPTSVTGAGPAICRPGVSSARRRTASNSIRVASSGSWSATACRSCAAGSPSSRGSSWSVGRARLASK